MVCHLTAQVKVIDHKGTFKDVDSSKWKINGTHIFNKNSGNIGIGNNNPQAKLHTTGTLRFEALDTNHDGKLTFAELTRALQQQVIPIIVIIRVIII